MRKTKLVNILSTFTKSELRRLKEFVYSPFFNKNVNIQLLLDYLIKQAPGFDAVGFSEAAAFEYVFKGEPFKEQTIPKLSSKLYKLIYQFVNVEFGKYDPINADVHYLKFLGERALINEYELHVNNVQKSIDKVTMRDADYFYKKFLVEEEIAKRVLRKDTRKKKVNGYQAASNALDKFYLCSKLIYLCQQLNDKITRPNEKHDFELMKELEEYIPKSSYYNIPAIKIWFTALQLLKNNEKRSHYFQLRDLIFQHYNQLNEFDIYNIITFLNNNARFIYLNRDDYYQETFELYRFQLDKGIFDNPVIFTPASFLNIVTTALLLDKKDWTKDFLEDRKDYDQNREDDVHCLSSAMLSFEEGDYPKAQDFLMDCKFKNIYFKLSERRLWMKVFFEQGMHDQVEHQVNSFRKFLSTNKEVILDFHLTAHRSFINIVYQIFNVIKTDKERIEELKQEINAIPALPEKRWLLNKIAELE